MGSIPEQFRAGFVKAKQLWAIFVFQCFGLPLAVAIPLVLHIRIQLRWTLCTADGRCALQTLDSVTN